MDTSECQPLYLEIQEFYEGLSEYETGTAGSSASGRETGFK
jgi:hypothetical protein